MKLLVLNQSEVEQLLPMSDCIGIMTEALTSLAKGEAYNPLRGVIRPPGAKGVLGMMPSYKGGEKPAFGIKVISVFKGNPLIGKDAHQGIVLMLSGETGEPLAMMNASAVTEIRTAAVSGVATRLLARKDAADLAIIGSGVQARSHLAAMASVRTVKRARVVSKNIDNARKFVRNFQSRYSFPLEVVERVEDAVRGADIIVTATSSVEPILKREWISPGAHLNVVGSSIPTTREVDSATMAASSLFVDRRESTLNEAGDYLFAMREGAIGPDHIRAELGEILTGTKPGRTSKDEITLFKSLGLAIEDLASAEFVYRRAVESKLGTWVEF
jgi:ornithine cyclodeaminase